MSTLTYNVKQQFPEWLQGTSVGVHDFNLTARDSTNHYAESDKVSVGSIKVGLNSCYLSSTSHCSYNGYNYVNSINLVPTLVSSSGLSSIFHFYDEDDEAYGRLVISDTSITFYKVNDPLVVYTVTDGWIDEKYRRIYFDSNDASVEMNYWIDANTTQGYHDKVANGNSTYMFYVSSNSYEMPTVISVAGSSGVSGSVGLGTWSYNRIDDNHGSVTIVNPTVHATIDITAVPKIESGRFVCVGQSGNSYYSTNGTSWVAMTGLSTTSSYYGVTYGNGRFVCVGQSGNSYYSTNGTSWVAMTGLSTTLTYYGVTYGNGRFVCVGQSGQSYYSTNGTSWVAMTGLPTRHFESVTYGNGRFVCVSGQSGNSYYSTNGTSWVAMTGLSTTSSYYGVTYGNGRFVCVGNNGQSYYSTNGTSWTAMSGFTSGIYYGVTYGNGRFVCVGNNGKSFYSTNGTSWIAMSGIAVSAAFYGVTYGNDRFVCVGQNGNSYYSTDGTTWTVMSGLASTVYYSVTYKNT